MLQLSIDMSNLKDEVAEVKALVTTLVASLAPAEAAEAVEELLPSPASTAQELQVLNVKLETDPEFRKKMVSIHHDRVPPYTCS